MVKVGNLLISLATIFLFLIASCTYTQKVRDGKFAYDRKQYNVAVPMLKREYNKAKTRLERGKFAYYLGASYEALNKPNDAIEWFKIAYDNQFGWEALKSYAHALKQSEQYEEARQAFIDLGIEIGSPYEYRKEVQACEEAIAWEKSDRKKYEVTPLGFNSRYSDYAPSLYKDNQLVFTSDRGTAEGDEVYNWTGNAFSDLFVVDLGSRNVASFDPLLNTPKNEGTAGFNANYSEVYFTRCSGGKKQNKHYCSLMVSKRTGNAWSIPEKLPFVKEEVNYGQPTLSKDGKTMYFECNDPEGWGGKDIWVVQRQGETWGTPKLLGRSINTEGNERFPYLDSDTLYFSSNYHGGMGGLDIFRSHKVNGRWTVAENLKAPINSGGDDFGYVIDYKAARESEDIIYTGYFTSSREGGKGADDIYNFTKKILPPLPEPEIKEEPVVIYKMILDGYILEKIYEVNNDPSSKILGRKPLANAKVDVILENGEKKQFETGEDGYFSFELEEDMDYNFFANKKEYLRAANTFSTKDVAKDPDNPTRRFEMEIELDKIFRDKEIVLENIYYDFEQWDIREDAKPTLNELIRTLTLNPNLKIELSSHTDCRGGDRYNENLSQKRAQSAVDYLIDNKINPERLIAKGYGETTPRADCNCNRCSEEEHQQNRRTSFKIIE